MDREVKQTHHVFYYLMISAVTWHQVTKMRMLKTKSYSKMLEYAQRLGEVRKKSWSAGFTQKMFSHFRQNVLLWQRKTVIVAISQKQNKQLLSVAWSGLSCRQHYAYSMNLGVRCTVITVH